MKSEFLKNVFSCSSVLWLLLMLSRDADGRVMRCRYRGSLLGARLEFRVDAASPGVSSGGDRKQKSGAHDADPGGAVTPILWVSSCGWVACPESRGGGGLSDFETSLPAAS